MVIFHCGFDHRLQCESYYEIKLLGIRSYCLVIFHCGFDHRLQCESYLKLIMKSNCWVLEVIVCWLWFFNRSRYSFNHSSRLQRLHKTIIYITVYVTTLILQGPACDMPTASHLSVKVDFRLMIILRWKHSIRKTV